MSGPGWSARVTLVQDAHVPLTHLCHRADAQHLCGESADHCLDFFVRRNNSVLEPRSGLMGS